jgi:predicted component of type VI protein secretion system
MKSELVPLNGDMPIPITRDVTVVGRRDYCDVVIDHESLSKRHCVLVRTDGLLMVRDLATTNGTKVNGQKVLWAALLPNDRLTLGGVKFRIYLGPDSAPGPSEQANRGAAGRQAAGAPQHAFAATSALGTPPPLHFVAPTPAEGSSFPTPPPVEEDEVVVLDDKALFDDDTGEDDEIIELD